MTADAATSTAPTARSRQLIPALKVRQWMPAWDRVSWNADEFRSQPMKWFYQFSMPAADLRALSGISRRTVDRRRGRNDLGIQRRHEVSRSAVIRRYVESGYPWSDLSAKQRRSGRFDDLRQPGWLPTAIVVNLLVEGSQRNGQKVLSRDLITVTDQPHSMAVVELPPGFDNDWTFEQLPPIEVIDGQHRLWAFTEDSSADFEVPVVAFVGLDISWQAYLFYTINIKPKKINRSLAFDLYPLLRDEEWLHRFEGPAIYRETRAQELVDLLWSTPASPWYRRINMLGDPGHRDLQVTQAAWVRSLLASFVKKWQGQRIQIGGLFGTKYDDQPALSWDLYTQAAFLILVGKELQNAIMNVDSDWTDQLRRASPDTHKKDGDPAFFGKHNLLNQDQGIRTLLQVTNDLFFVTANLFTADVDVRDGDELDRDDTENEDETTDAQLVHTHLNALTHSSIRRRAESLAQALATYDWRASSAPGLSDAEVILRQGFRGSSGYRLLREDVLRHLRHSSGWVADASEKVRSRLGMASSTPAHQ